MTLSTHPTAIKSRALRAAACTGLFICPDCGRKTVRLALRAHGEDNYRCVYRRGRDRCDFWVFADPEHDAEDAAKLLRLWNANPEHRICCGLNAPPAWFMRMRT